MESEQKENSQPLLKQRYEPFSIEETKENVEIEQENKFDQFKDFVFGIKIQKSQRDVYLDGKVNPINKQNNFIKNSKYNAFTFLPLVLFEQFHQFINLFYLGLTITQCISFLKVGFLIDYLGPLALVVAISLLKELYDDIQRHMRDHQINNYEYGLITRNGIQKISSGKIKVGQIVEVKCNERIPADLLVLYADDEQGNVFIRTDQLDGETDWKLRKAVKATQNLIRNGADPSSLISQNSYATCQEPIANIYQFSGLFNYRYQKESLSLEHVMWANTVLATGRIYGLVILNGKETRMAMNSKTPKTKFGILDDEVNWLSFLLFVMMSIMAGIVTAFSGQPATASVVTVAYIRYLVLLSNIIPISMRVNLEFAKLVYSYKINIDPQIEGTITRNSNIPESLGRIQYLLSDKTGTLTQNDMIFKKLSLASAQFSEEDKDEMKKILIEQCKLNEYPLQDVVNFLNKNNSKLRLKRERDQVFRDLMFALCLCHNVTPIYDGENPKTFQASSPDEIALVKIAEEIGIELISRDQIQITIKDCIERKQKYEILNNFPFSSETKRMGIILYNREANRYIFYVKGADAVMKQLVQEHQRGFIDEECENLAREGFRTLVITQKLLTKSEYENWKCKFDQANEQIENRDTEIQKAISLLEKDMEFLGITGVEDKLQEEVCSTLENVRNAGINVWMLTGDKIETAICIAISSGIKSPTQQIFLIKETSDPEKFQQQINTFGIETNNNLLVIDGTSLNTALTYFEELFFTIATKSQSVVCCRCSPTQKAQVTECIKFYTKKVVACIGDGGNDVGMIQSADVGIGIEGKEGKQAALASDFSIVKFKYLNVLLLWHGRLSYKRSALLSQFVIHRGLIISVIQAVFMFVFYFLSISIFSGGLLLGYSTIYTMFPVFSIIFDEDVDIKIALQYPPLYRSLQKGRDLNAKTFMVWVWKSIFQGVIIMILALVMFKNIFLEIETVAFTALIFNQYALTLSELHSLHIVMIISNVASAVIYILSIMWFPNQLLVSAMTFQFFFYVIVIVLVSWSPCFIAQKILKKYDPSDYEKIMANVKRELINTKIFK
ncbi:unnamed protein product [Paramecium pentaurelia]|uniref:Phospholipid-transporting ATPase n=1 Tax=Paramecium pentaurelia TaxID=43138 RepID=A0A8S1WG55_9CILI|nr:unnamed protein product [Paramecium pentaurelia]